MSNEPNVIEKGDARLLADLEKQAAIEWAISVIEGEGIAFRKPGEGAFYGDPCDEEAWDRACRILDGNKMLTRHERDRDLVRVG